MKDILKMRGEYILAPQPKAINTEAENEQAIVIAQDLEHHPQCSPAEDT